MDGQTGNMIVQLYRESRSVLALTAGDVRGKSIGEGKGEALVGRSVETHAQWMRIMCIMLLSSCRLIFSTI